MPFELPTIVPWGRSLEESSALFALDGLAFQRGGHTMLVVKHV